MCIEKAYLLLGCQQVHRDGFRCGINHLGFLPQCAVGLFGNTSTAYLKGPTKSMSQGPGTIVVDEWLLRISDEETKQASYCSSSGRYCWSSAEPMLMPWEKRHWISEYRHRPSRKCGHGTMRSHVGARKRILQANTTRRGHNNRRPNEPTCTHPPQQT